MSRKDILLALLITIIWGVNFSVIKLGLESIDPFLLASIRFFLTAFPLVFFVSKPDVKLFYIPLYGILFGVGAWGMLNMGIHFGVSAGVASLLIQLNAYFTIIFGLFLFSERLNRYQIIGMIISLIGLMVSVIYKEDGSSVLSLLFVLLAAFSLGLSNVVVKKSAPTNMLSFLVWSSLFAPLPLLGMAYLSDSDFSLGVALNEINTTGIFSILFQVYVTTLFAYWVWISLLKKYPLSIVAPISLLVPVFGFIGSVVIFNETITLIKSISSVLILIGLMLFVFNKKLMKKNYE